MMPMPGMDSSKGMAVMGPPLTPDRGTGCSLWLE